jgi:hypothetical protein
MNTSSTTKSESTTNPWGPQAGALTNAFGKAGSLVDNSYTGDRVAQFTPDQLSTFQKMVGYGNTSGAAGSLDATGNTLTGAGTGALTGALTKLGAFNPTGGTDSNIASANAYADAAASPAAVDAAMRDARRQVSEQALPQIARNAAATGNAMSSRRGISEGIIERGLAEKGADVSAGLRQHGFDTGLSLAEQGRQFDNNAMLDALKSGGTLGAGAAAAGTGALTGGVDTAGKLFTLAGAGGAGEQASGQAALDNNIGKSDSAWDNLLKYYGVVGSQNWGGTTSGTQEKQPSIWETIGGLMSAGGSLAKGFKG